MIRPSNGINQLISDLKSRLFSWFIHNKFNNFGVQFSLWKNVILPSVIQYKDSHQKYYSFLHDYQSEFFYRPYPKLVFLEGGIFYKYTIELSDINKVFPIYNMNPSHLIQSKSKNFKLETKAEFRLNNNQLYYYFHRDQSKVELSSDKPFFVGNPFQTEQNSKTKFKIVLIIFIDGLSSFVFDNYKIESLMPSTFRFFDKGLISSSFYSSAEWTLPSTMSILTSKYTANHSVFDANLKYSRVNINEKLASQYFQDAGYMTTFYSANWRQTPHELYCKGVDKFIYKNSQLEQETANNLIIDYISHIRTYENRSHFSFLSLFDLHNIITGKSLNSELQVKIKPDLISKKSEDKISVFAKYDNVLLEHYLLKLKQLDSDLDTLYKYLDKQYRKDQILVCLTSDHGQSYFSEASLTLEDERIKVPFLINRINKKTINSLSPRSNVDILPTLLDLAGIKYNEEELDGTSLLKPGSKRKILSESIYFGQSYKIVIRENNISFFVDFINPLKQDRIVDLSSFNLKKFNGKIPIITELRDLEIIIDFIRDHLNVSKTLIVIN